MDKVRGHVRPQSSKLDGVEQAPPDPILGVSDAFKKCDNPAKLNLGVGAYRTEDLQPYVLKVRPAEGPAPARSRPPDGGADAAPSPPSQCAPPPKAASGSRDIPTPRRRW